MSSEDTKLPVIEAKYLDCKTVQNVSLFTDGDKITSEYLKEGYIIQNEHVTISIDVKHLSCLSLFFAKIISLFMFVKKLVASFTFALIFSLTNVREKIENLQHLTVIILILCQEYPICLTLIQKSLVRVVATMTPKK